MLCQTPQSLAHSTRFLSQENNLLPTWGCYTFPPPLSHLCLFQSFQSAGSSLFSHLSLSVYCLSCICKSLLVVFPCIIQMLERWKLHACSHPSLPLNLSFLDCSLNGRVGFLLWAELLNCRIGVLPLLFEKAKHYHRQLWGAAPTIWQKSKCSMIQTHKRTWRRSWTGIVLYCRLTVHLLLVGTYCLTVLWQPSSILNQILWCVYETTIFLWYE